MTAQRSGRCGVNVGTGLRGTVPIGSRPPMRWRAPVLVVLAGLFLLRVVGQLLVSVGGVGWLPAEEHWQSGLLPYPALLASQAVILGLLLAMIADAWRGDLGSATRLPWLGQALRWFGGLYLASVAVRYGVTMAMQPEWRWFGRTIPILFHALLATSLLIYSGVLLARSRPVRRGAEPRTPTPDPPTPSSRSDRATVG